MTVALEGSEWSAARRGRTLPPGKTRCPLYRRLGGPQGRSGLAEYLIPIGIPSRTVQPVVSRYLCVCVYIYIYIYISVCVCVCIYIYIHTHTHTHIHVCVCFKFRKQYQTHYNKSCLTFRVYLDRKSHNIYTSKKRCE